LAVYKVPQDVEADDKLIGPFSFRQFIYLIIVGLAIAAAWGLAQIFIGLVILPLPVIIFFGAIALPLRKDQPMEIYLAAMLKFFLKPRIRLWQPEGQVNLVTIIAPHINEIQATRGISGSEAQQRLSYLAQVIDTQGWASRGVTTTSMASLNDTVAAEASTVDDVLDQSVGIGRQFDSLIEQQDTIRMQQVTQQFQSAMHQPAQVTPAATFSPFPLADDETTVAPAVAPTFTPQQPASNVPDFNPYPSQMHQHVIDPRGPAPKPTPRPEATPLTAPARQEPSVTTSDEPLSPDIMRLANNKDLSISAIAREAHRLEEDEGEEVVVSLR
jgi:hypothetical protein